MELLFERFLSEERGEWPDIDLDLPSGDQREKVIQYVYRRYGGGNGAQAGAAVGAAMTANVITYRDRSAAREVAKALGYAPDQVDRLARQLGSFRYDLERGDPKELHRELAAAGFDPAEPRNRLFGALWRHIQNLPRHLGQHSGGMVIAAGRLDEVVPLEPAAMPGRVVVQWDKDDCADLGIIKVDLLGLGMLNALERTIPLIREHEGRHVDLAHLPADDPAVYAMLRAADTVGVFQVESRAQMASLPRNAPERFYDLVIQVAIIRPGPITGGMVHPFFERRLGREPVHYFHPSLEPILKRTLGVPIFQEQLLRMAMAVSGFTGGEAEELRRAMGFKRSVERMQSIERRLRDGMAARGITGENQDRIVQSITSFALYGFPESHAASFALIAYTSAWLKCHHPTAFLIGLLDAWPMGFYHPASLVKDAQRHGVVVLPIDVNFSEVGCRWEEPASTAGIVAGSRSSSPAPGPASATRTSGGGARLRFGLAGSGRTAQDGGCSASEPPPRENSIGSVSGGGPQAPDGKTPRAAGACRLGLRFVADLRRAAAEAIVEARRRGGPFRDADDLARRARLQAAELERLAEVGALASLGLGRRAALWQAALAARPAGPLLDGDPPVPGSPLREMTAYEATVADFAGTGMTVGAHPMDYWRGQLERDGVVPTAVLPTLPRGARARIAGAVIVRQRPGTAKGTLFITLEDESGMAQAIVAPELARERRATLVGHAGLVVEGIVESKDGSVSLRAERFWPLPDLVETPSHDFR
jgi:error-prone DNA polymerase